MKKSKCNDELSYKELSNAIIIQAVNDYESELAKRCPDTYKIDSIEKFFRSQWFQALSDMDGEYLIKEVRRMMKKNEL